MSAVRKASAKLILLQNRDFSVIIYMFGFLLVLSLLRSVIGTIVTAKLQYDLIRTSGTGANPNFKEFLSAKYSFVPLRDLSPNGQVSLLMKHFILCKKYSLIRHGCHP